MRILRTLFVAAVMGLSVAATSVGAQEIECKLCANVDTIINLEEVLVHYFDSLGEDEFECYPGMAGDFGCHNNAYAFYCDTPHSTCYHDEDELLALAHEVDAAVRTLRTPANDIADHRSLSELLRATTAVEVSLEDGRVTVADCQGKLYGEWYLTPEQSYRVFGISSVSKG